MRRAAAGGFPRRRRRPRRRTEPTRFQLPERSQRATCNVAAPGRATGFKRNWRKSRDYKVHASARERERYRRPISRTVSRSCGLQPAPLERLGMESWHTLVPSPDLLGRRILGAVRNQRANRGITFWIDHRLSRPGHLSVVPDRAEQSRSRASAELRAPADGMRTAESRSHLGARQQCDLRLPE